MKTSINLIGRVLATLLLGSTMTYAGISTVTPVEGTVGTEITLQGTGFGDKRGKVQLGTDSCKVLAWSDSRIVAQVTTPQPAGNYPVAITQQGSKKTAASMTYSSFAIKAPRITPSASVRLVAPGELVTVSGAFFGDKKGDVLLHDTPGQTVRAKVRDWGQDSIRFEVPDGLTGMLLLKVVNEVGFDTHRFWATLTPLPPGATTSQTYTVADSAFRNAAGVYFNGVLWAFAPQYNPGTLQYDLQCWWLKDGKFTQKDVPQPGNQTRAQVSPLVVDHELFIFVSAQDGVISWKRFNPATGTWGTWKWFADLKTDPEKELAPAYNSVKKQIELYYWAPDNTIRWLYTGNKGASWYYGADLGLTDVKTAPSALYWQQTADSGVTLLSVGAGSSKYITDSPYLGMYYLQDGKKVGDASHPEVAVYGSGRVQVADLGEEYLAQTWILNPGDVPSLRKLNKQTGVWEYPYEPLNEKSHWPPNLVVNYELVPDSSSMGGRWDAILYLFRGYNYGFGTSVKMESIENLGYWQEVTDSPAVTDFSSSDANYLQTWPVIGVIDAPPFIQNGEEYKDDPDDVFKCTRIEFKQVEENMAETEISFQAGFFVETGEKSPLKLELCATAGNKWANQVTTTVEFENTLLRSMSGRVAVYYLAPEVEVHQMQWHNPEPTENYMYPMRVTANSRGRVHTFDPEEFPVPGAIGMGESYFDLSRFPLHKAENDLDRLATYTAPTGDTWFADYADWNIGQEQSLLWEISNEQSSAFSINAEMKIGANLEGVVAFGIQGSFEFQMTTSTKLTSASKLYLVNPWRADEFGTPYAGQIGAFEVDARWMAPAEDAFWVPLNRRGSGDKPWFITYGVNMQNVVITK